ncbi:CLK4-associating serine/arginine rich protein [Magallana gigas]
MWHEARKQEKKIRGLMVDYKKRAERRREFYEKIKLDPTQFLRVYGRPVKVNLDPAVAIAAESPQSMMPWQGDKENMIDRFDVRAHLDIMPKFNLVTPQILSLREEEEERRANYERYRTLVENECAGVSEEQALHQIYIDEMYGAVNKGVEEDKKKLAEKKAAIGYTYEDSTPVGEKKEEEESDEESDLDVETVDLDVTLDIDTLTNEQKVLLNQCAQTYGMKDEDFVCWLTRDKEEMEEIRLAKMLEEEKAQFAGRKSRRERRAYKEKKLAGRKLSPPSYAARDSPKYEPYQRRSSSSRSRSCSPEEPKKTKVEFITSFGGESDEEGVVQGPALPPQLNVSESPHTWKKKKEAKKRKRRFSSRSRSKTPEKSSTSRSPEKSKSSSGKFPSEPVKKESNSRRSGDGRLSSGSSQKSISNTSRSRSRSYSSSRSRSRSRSSRSRSRSSRSRSRSRSFSSRSPSPQKTVVKRYRRKSLSSSAESSSDSESDKKRKSDGQKSVSGVGNTSLATSQVNKLTPQERLKRRMQAALNRQYKADKKADIERQNKMEQERQDREEELRVRTLEMRRREREKRHREMEDRQSSSDSEEERSSPKIRKRSTSPKHRSPKLERQRSPERRRSPPSEHRRSSLQDRRRSPDRRKSPSKERRRNSPDRGRNQNLDRRRSPGYSKREWDRHRSPPRGRRERSPRNYRHRSRSRSSERKPRIVNY